jgi:hypothetical protein
VSDLLLEPRDIEEPLRALRAAGHDVTVLHIMDPAERDFTAGEALYRDPESGVEVPAAAHVRAAYRDTVDSVIGEWRQLFGRLGAGYEVVDTASPFAIPLRRAFAARERLF